MLMKTMSLYHSSFSINQKNISENPFAFATITDPNSMQQFNLELQYDHSETNGDLFDDMDMKLQAIASMSGMSDIFKLQAADVYKVLSIK